MFQFRTILLLFLFALIAIVGSTSGGQGCDPSQRRAEMYDEQSRQYSESMDRMGRITLDCETTASSTGGSGGGSGGNNGFMTIIDLSVGLFFLFLVAIGIWFFCVRRQKAMNAAAINSSPGAAMGYGVDEKTKTVAMSAPAGKLSNGDTNV